MKLTKLGTVNKDGTVIPPEYQVMPGDEVKAGKWYLDFRYWLISLLAGNDAIVMNVKITMEHTRGKSRGSVQCKRGIFCNVELPYDERNQIGLTFSDSAN